VSHSGQRRLPATEIPQYGQCLSMVPPGHDLVGCEMRGDNLSIGPDVCKRYRIVKFRQHPACLLRISPRPAGRAGVLRRL
jgi:hypothetical protein